MPAYLVTMDSGESLELTHHGVKGMKWGVRKHRESAGPRLSKSQQSQLKIDKFKSKIERSRFGGDKNFIMRNTINDRRRGRIKQIENKRNNRAAKEAYLANKTKANKAKLNKTRIDRFGGMAGQHALGASARDRGAYNRQRSKGKSVAKAALIVAGGMLVKNMAGNAASRKVEEKGREMFLKYADKLTYRG